MGFVLCSVLLAPAQPPTFTVVTPPTFQVVSAPQPVAAPATFSAGSVCVGGVCRPAASVPSATVTGYAYGYSATYRLTQPAPRVRVVRDRPRLMGLFRR